MKDHEIAQLVNALRDVAHKYRDSPQLRDRIGALIAPALCGAGDADLRAMLSSRGFNPDEVLGAKRSPKPLAWSDELSATLNVLAGKREELRALRTALFAWLAELSCDNGEYTAEEVHHRLDRILDTPTPAPRTLTDDECAALTRKMWALDDPTRHSDIEYGRAWVNCVTEALQQSSSGITAGAKNVPQVVDFGAAGPNRTGDLLITNQDKNTPETSQNQDVTPKTATAQPAQVAPTESSGCEGVTAALDLIKMALSDAGRLTGATEEAFPKLTRLARDSLIKAHDAWHDVAAQWAERDNFRWITIAHMLCTDAGVPQGHIADRLEGLRAALQAKQKQSVDVTRIGFGTYEVRMNCVTDTAINGLGGGFPAHLKAGDKFVCTLGADFTVDGKPMPIRDVLVAWADYMGKQLVFTGEHDTGEFTT